jgi:hypothetical protein
MKKLSILMAMLFMSPVLGVCGDRQQVYQRYIPKIGSYYKNGQLYKGFVLVPGSKIVKQGDRQQIYKNYLLVPGSHYKRGQKHKGYIPQYGDSKRR